MSPPSFTIFEEEPSELADAPAARQSTASKRANEPKESISSCSSTENAHPNLLQRQLDSVTKPLPKLQAPEMVEANIAAVSTTAAAAAPSFEARYLSEWATFVDAAIAPLQPHSDITAADVLLLERQMAALSFAEPAADAQQDDESEHQHQAAALSSMSAHSPISESERNAAGAELNALTAQVMGLINDEVDETSSPVASFQSPSQPDSLVADSSPESSLNHTIERMKTIESEFPPASELRPSPELLPPPGLLPPPEQPSHPSSPSSSVSSISDPEDDDQPSKPRAAERAVRHDVGSPDSVSSISDPEDDDGSDSNSAYSMDTSTASSASVSSIRSWCSSSSSCSGASYRCAPLKLHGTGSTKGKKAAVPTLRLKVKLHRHQREAVRWMSGRERGRSPSQSQDEDEDEDEDKVTDKVGQEVERNAAGSASGLNREVLHEVRGGVLADSMGLGKTVCVLALMVQEQQKQKQKLAAAAKREVATKVRKAEQQRQQTLVVAPLSLLGQWEKEIKQKTNLSVYVHHGKERARAKASGARIFARFDVILTTFDILKAKEVLLPQQQWQREEEEGGIGNSASCSSVFVGDGNGKGSGLHAPASGSGGSGGWQRKRRCGGTEEAEREAVSLLHTVEWTRVVLDEAHLIANARTARFKAACRLRAKARWCLSGTPIQNKKEDLRSLFRFIRAPVEGGSEVGGGGEGGTLTIEEAVRWLVLRRTLESIQNESEHQQDDDNSNDGHRNAEESGSSNDSNGGIGSGVEDDEERSSESGESSTSTSSWRSRSSRSSSGVGSSRARRARGDSTSNHGPLPPKHERLVRVEFSSKAERRAHDALYANTKRQLIKLTEGPTKAKARGTMHIFELLLRLRQVCNHRSLVDLRDTADATEDKSDGEDSLSDEDCFIVDEEHSSSEEEEDQEDDIVTSTKLDSLLLGLQRLSFSKPSKAETKRKGTSQPNPRLISCLIVSEWPSFLDLIRDALEGKRNRARKGKGKNKSKKGKGAEQESRSQLHESVHQCVHQCVQLDGRMSKQQREYAVDDFQNPPPLPRSSFPSTRVVRASDGGGRRRRRRGGKAGNGSEGESDDDGEGESCERLLNVMLLSSRAGGIGLNLTTASHVFVMEPNWNPFVEEQAIGRCHRIGQMQEVQVVRFLIADSIEDKVERLKRKKMTMAKGVLAEEEEEEEEEEEGGGHDQEQEGRRRSRHTAKNRRGGGRRGGRAGECGAREQDGGTNTRLGVDEIKALLFSSSGDGSA